MSETKFDAVRAATARNFRVFPLRANSKMPAIAGWPEKAASDIELLRAHWEKHPEANIGIATGWTPIEGKYLVVIDIDIGEHKDGFDSLSKFEMFNDKLPATYTVRTRRGGLHLYFWSRKAVGSSASKLGAGIDVRGVGGFVVAPGSTVEGAGYTLEIDQGIVGLPEWLAELCDAYREKAVNAEVPLVTMDDPGALQRGRAYLEEGAPEAIEYAGGNHTTLTVALRLKDFGISRGAALNLMLEGWNDIKASPSWEPQELRQIVDNAYRYGQNQPGNLNPAAEFEAFDQSQPFSDGSQVSGFSIPAVTPFEVRSLPRRRWIMPKLFIRGKVTVVVAPPGAGKSTLTIGLGLSVATGKDFMGVPVLERTHVAMYQNEDDMDEIRRRLAAAMQHHGIDFKDLLDEQHVSSLYIQSGENRMFTIAVRGQDKLIAPKDFRAMTNWLKANDIGMAVFDPFAETHEAAENDNGEILKVAKLYRQMAQEANCAVVLIHHTKKPQGAAADAFQGDMNSGRGASSLMGVARVAITLYPMTKKDAKAYSIQDHDRRYYVRLDDAKANLSLGDTNPTWFKRISVPLLTDDIEGAHETHDVNGFIFATEEVGALEPAKLTQIQEADAELEDVIDAVERAIADIESISTRDLAKLLRQDPLLEHLTQRQLTYRVNQIGTNSDILLSLNLAPIDIKSSGGRVYRHFEKMS